MPLRPTGLWPQLTHDQTDYRVLLALFRSRVNTLVPRLWLKYVCVAIAKKSSKLPGLMDIRLGTSTLIQSMEAVTSSEVWTFLQLVSLGVKGEQYPGKCDGESDLAAGCKVSLFYPFILTQSLSISIFIFTSI